MTKPPKKREITRSLDAAGMQKRLDRIQDLPTLPAIAMEVNRTLRGYDTSLRQVTDAIEKDQALVALILKLVNSTFFGFRSRIANISHAVALLGFHSLRNVIVSVSVIQSFHRKRYTLDFDIGRFWEHSVASAVISRQIATEVRMAAPEDAFTAGLLHDVGKLLIIQYFPDEFAAIWTRMHTEEISFYEAEKAIIPIPHPRLGAYLLDKWQLPAGLRDAARCHHDIRSEAEVDGLLAAVHAADIIANRLCAGDVVMPRAEWLHPDAASPIAPALSSLNRWLPAVTKEVEDACKFFLESRR